MIRADMIPDEVVEAAARAHAIANEGHDEWWNLHVEKVRASIAAALNAWPGMWKHPYTKAIILPLTESGNE